MKMAKKLLAMLLGLTLIVSMGVSVGATETETTNLLTNPSFENGLEGWTAKRTSHQQESALSGEYSAEFAAPSEDAGTKFAQYPLNYEAGLLSQKVTGLKGKSMYKFSGYVHTVSSSEITRDDYLYMFYTFYSDDTALGTTVEEQRKTPVNEWTKLQLFITLPNDANSVEIGVVHKGGSTFTRTYDAFSLEEITLAESGGNLLLNAGFENGFEGWYAAGADNGSYSKTPNQVAYSADFTAPVSDAGEYCAQYPAGYAISLLTQRVDGLRSGNIYLFSGYMHTKHATNTTDPYVYMTYTFYKNGEAVGANTDVKIATTLGAWVKVEQEVFIPAGVDGIDIGFKTTNGGAYVRSYDKISFMLKENLLTNGGFEENDPAQKAATGWFVTSTDATFTFTEDSHSGESAYTSDGWARVEQAVPAVEGTRYQFTYWFKSTNATEAMSSYVRVRFFDQEPAKSNTNPGTSLSAINVNTTPSLSTDGWQKHVAYFLTPPGTKGISVVLHSYTSTNKKAACMYDDVELKLGENAVEFLGFSSNEPQNLGCVTTQNTSGSYPDSGLYEVSAKNPATTLHFTNTLSLGEKVCASAISLSNPSTALVLALFSEDGNKKCLHAVDIAKPDETTGFLATGIQVPDEGTYYIKAYIWNSMDGLKSIMEPIELR